MMWPCQLGKLEQIFIIQVTIERKGKRKKKGKKIVSTCLSPFFQIRVHFLLLLPHPPALHKPNVQVNVDGQLCVTNHRTKAVTKGTIDSLSLHLLTATKGFSLSHSFLLFFKKSQCSSSRVLELIFRPKLWSKRWLDGSN